MKQIPFTKMHGLGNDFVVIDTVTPESLGALVVTPELAKAMCDRRFGIGADQLLWLREPVEKGLDARMEILNADGSVAEMCGNGIRAVALYLNRYGSEKKTTYGIETLAGIQKVEIKKNAVLVDMGIPKLGAGFPESGEEIQIQDRALRFFEVNVGNPHAVIYVDDVARFPVGEVGPLVETHRRFPNRTNVEFVEVRGSKAIKIRVWERGAGITLACGTGACAAAIASIALKKTLAPLEVLLPGGKLTIGWNGPGTSVMMEGPAEEVYRGVYFFK